MQRAIAVLTLALVLAASGLASSTPGRGPEPVLQVQIEARIEGITHDGDDFWVSQFGIEGSEPPMFHRVSEAGVTLESVEQFPAWQNGVHDIHFWNNLLWGSECFWIRGFDLDGTWDGSTMFAGPTIFNPSNPCRLVCLNSTNGFWYAGGWGQRAYRTEWDGTPAGMPIWNPVTPDPVPGASGVAYDADHDCLWLADGTSNTLYKLSPDGGPSLGQLPLLDPALGSLRGVCVAETETLVYLAAVIVDDDERAPGWMMLWDIEDINDAATPVESASWSRIKAIYR